MDNQDQNDPYEIKELARRLYSAYISYQMGLSLNYYYTTYAKNKEVGQYWIDLALLIINDQSKKQIFPVPK